MTTLPCPNRSHSPRQRGDRWDCDDCAKARKIAAEERANVEAKAAARSAVTDAERSIFVAAVRDAARGGIVRQNDVRDDIRGRIFHKHVGPLWVWAQSSGLLVEVEREQSTDTTGRNAHHDSGVYQLRSAAA